MQQIIALLIANLYLILAVILFTWSSWLPTLRPDLFYIFRIYEHDFLDYQEKKMFLPFKGKKDKYEFDKCEYDKGKTKPYIAPSGVYTWNFEKGKSEPITFKAQENTDGNLAVIIKREGSKAIDDIVAGEPTFEDFLKTWGVFIVGFILVAMIGYMITKNEESSKATIQLLVNMSRRG